MTTPSFGLLRLLATATIASALLSAEVLAHGDLHARIEAVTAKIKARPDSADLYLERGELHRLHEEWPQAQADFDRAEKLNPELLAVALARSRLQLSRQEYKSALKEAERFLEKHPRHSQALAVKARALAGQKRFEDAAAAWLQVIEAAPAPDVENYYERAIALASAGAEHIDAALSAIDDGLANLGNVPTLGLYAVDLEVRRKRYDAALERLDRMMPKSGRKETWRERRGDILAAAGKADEARAEYVKAVEEMEALPARNRGTKASVALEQRLREKAGKGKR